MDVLRDTEMPDRCTDVPQKTKRCMGCTDVEGVWGIQMYGGVWTYGVYRCPLS